MKDKAGGICFPHISIVVPVYNTLPYLDDCIESVLSQTYTDWELLLVDDGSTDGSAARCDEFAQKDGRIKILHQPNSGPSVARNAGIRMSKGSWLLFLDSDDMWLSPTLLENLLAAAQIEKADLALFNYTRFEAMPVPPYRPCISFPDCRELTPSQIQLLLSQANAYQSSACTKMVKRKLIRNLLFIPGVRGEDIDWCAQLMLRSPRIVVVPTVGYGYRKREGSCTAQVDARLVQDICALIARLAAQGEGLEKGDIQLAFMGYVAFQYSTLLLNYRLAKCRNPELANQIKALSPLLRYAQCRQAKLVRYIYRLLGFRLTSRLLSVYFKLTSG